MYAQYNIHPQAFEFEIQPYDERNRGDTSQWTPVTRSATDAEKEENGALDLSPLATATGLSPSTSYRFRVSGRYAHGIQTVSGISEVFTTGKLFCCDRLLCTSDSWE